MPSDGVAVTAKVTLEGPFFVKNPGKTFYQNLGDMLAKLAEEMQTEVEAQIAAHASEMPFYTGWSHDHAVGYTTSAKTGKHWATWAAVGSVTAGMGRDDARRTKAAAASIERRFHPYRNVKAGVYRARALITADLTRGLE